MLTVHMDKLLNFREKVLLAPGFEPGSPVLYSLKITDQSSENLPLILLNIVCAKSCSCPGPYPTVVYPEFHIGCRLDQELFILPSCFHLFPNYFIINNLHPINCISSPKILCVTNNSFFSSFTNIQLFSSKSMFIELGTTNPPFI